MPNKNYTPKPPDYIPGDPGYRNRGNRTGLDPFDTYRGAAYFEGLFYKRLFTGQLKTRNPLAICLLILVGAALVIPVIAYAMLIYVDPQTAISDDESMLAMILFIPMAIFGLALFISGLLNGLDTWASG